MTHRMRFGIFLAPFHKAGINPTLALEQDLELIQWLDRCDYSVAYRYDCHAAIGGSVPFIGWDGSRLGSRIGVLFARILWNWCAG